MNEVILPGVMAAKGSYIGFDLIPGDGSLLPISNLTFVLNSEIGVGKVGVAKLYTGPQETIRLQGRCLGLPLSCRRAEKERIRPWLRSAKQGFGRCVACRRDIRRYTSASNALGFHTRINLAGSSSRRQ